MGWTVISLSLNNVFQQIVDEIVTHFNTTTNASRQTDNSSVATSETSQSEDPWHGFHFFSGVQRETPMEETLLLDSGSGIDLFCNPNWLSDIRSRTIPALIGTNAGSLSVDEEGEWNTYGSVPFSADAVTNILSLGVVTDRYRVTMDSAVDNAFYVHTPKRVL